MQTILIYIFVNQLAVLHGKQIFHKAIYAQIGSEVMMSCQISKETSTKSWRKGLTLVTRGLDINRNVRGHARLELITDEGFYNLRINNITEYDFSTYWCETQQGNSIITQGSKLIHLVASRLILNEETIIVTSRVIRYEDTTIDKLNMSFQSTLRNSPTSVTGIGHSFYYGLFITGFAVLCLSVGFNVFINKFRMKTSRTEERNDNEHPDVLHGNRSNNDSANDTALGENEYLFPHYEIINENEMIEMLHPTGSPNRSTLPCTSKNVQSLQPKIGVIQDTSVQKLDRRRKTNEDDKVSNTNTNFKTCSFSASGQSGEVGISERDKKADEYPNQYKSLNMNDMEYLNSYSTPMIENN